MTQAEIDVLACLVFATSPFAMLVGEDGIISRPFADEDAWQVRIRRRDFGAWEDVKIPCDVTRDEAMTLFADAIKRMGPPDPYRDPAPMPTPCDRPHHDESPCEAPACALAIALVEAVNTGNMPGVDAFSRALGYITRGVPR